MKILDCDLHNTYRSQQDLYPYLEEPYLSRLKEKGFGYPQETYQSTIHAKHLNRLSE